MNFFAFQDRVHVNYSYLQISFKMHKEKTSINFCAYQSKMYEFLFLITMSRGQFTVLEMYF